MKLKIGLAFLLLFKLTIGQSQQIARLDGSKISFTEIDKTVKLLMDTANVQGLDLAILNNKKTVFIKSYGYKNKLQNELLDTASVMYGASFSKAVFAYLTMKLVQEKVIDLDKPLCKYLSKPISEYEYFSDLKSDERWKLITARMCLSHTTGLPNVRWLHPNNRSRGHSWSNTNLFYARYEICLFRRSLKTLAISSRRNYQQNS